MERTQIDFLAHLWNIFRAFTNGVTEGTVQGRWMQVWAHGDGLDLDSMSPRLACRKQHVGSV